MLSDFNDLDLPALDARIEALRGALPSVETLGHLRRLSLELQSAVAATRDAAQAPEDIKQRLTVIRAHLTVGVLPHATDCAHVIREHLEGLRERVWSVRLVDSLDATFRESVAERELAREALNRLRAEAASLKRSIDARRAYLNLLDTLVGRVEHAKEELS